MRLLALAALVFLSACSWFGWHRAAPRPDPTQIIVTGAPAGATVYVDGTPAGPPVARNDQSQILDVAPGSHKVEIHVNDAVVYREDTYVGRGEHRTVTVLSGLRR